MMDSLVPEAPVAPQLSLIFPIFNEEDVLEKALRRVEEQLSAVEYSYEIVCVNDGSSDDSAAILEEAARSDRQIVPVHLSRNFGKEAALSAGLDAARGDAAILIDADLQHPPELIPQMVALWEQGFDVVEARKAARGEERLVYRILSKTFYAIAGLSSTIEIRGSSDYKLLDRQVIEALKMLPEKTRFFRGLVNWIGFRTTAIDFEVEERIGGKSGWSVGQLFRYAVNNILAFTVAPLYFVAWLGLITTFLGLALGAQTLYNYLSGNAVSGFTTVILLIISFAGIILIAVGTVAIYLAKVLEEVKGRPVYIIRRSTPSNPVARR